MRFSLVIFFFALSIASYGLKFTSNQQKLLLSLSKHFYIKNFLILKKSVPDGKNLTKLKKFSKLNIYVQQTSFKQIFSTLQNGFFNHYHKTLILLEDYYELADLFHEKNEEFLSVNIWAIFLTHNLNIGILKAGMYIPYNCQFLAIKSDKRNHFQIFEYFNMKIFIWNIHITKFGEWNEYDGLIVSEPDFYQKRFDMNQTLIPAVALHSPHPCSDSNICMYEEIINEMGRIMNFKPIYKNLDELEELLMTSSEFSYEIFIGLFTLDSVGFSKDAVGPIRKSRAYFNIKYMKSYEQGESTPYIRPFQINLWKMIILWNILFGLSIAYIDYWSSIKTRNKFSIIESFFRSYESLTSQCGSNIPKTISSFLATIITRLLSLILLYLYSAVVLSFITVRIIKFPFTDLQELINDGTFKIGHEQKTFFKYFFRDSNDPLIKTAHEKFLLPLEEMPSYYWEGAERLCQDPKFALTTFNDRLHAKCKILQIPKPFFFTWDAFLLRDHSCYRRIFNRILKSFHSSGILKRMNNIIQRKPEKEQEHENTDPVELNSIKPLCILICFLYLIAVAVLIFEICYNRLTITKKLLSYKFIIFSPNQSCSRKNNQP